MVFRGSFISLTKSHILNDFLVYRHFITGRVYNHPNLINGNEKAQRRICCKTAGVAFFCFLAVKIVAKRFSSPIAVISPQSALFTGLGRNFAARTRRIPNRNKIRFYPVSAMPYDKK